MKIKILVFADLHGGLNALLDKYTLETPDLIFILGDLCDAEAKKIDAMFKDIPKLGIHGNHDTETVFEQTQITDIFGIFAESDEFSVTAMQGSSRYKPSQYYGYTQDESIEACKKLRKASIFLSHDGPYDKNKDDAHCGLQGIDWYIKNNQPDIFMYGHHHKNQHYQIGNTDCYCVYEIALFTIENNKVIDVKNFNL